MRAGAHVIAILGDTCSLIDESYTVSEDSLESDTVPRLPGLASDSTRPSGRQRGAYRKSDRDFVRVHLVDFEFDSWEFRTPYSALGASWSKQGKVGYHTLILGGSHRPINLTRNNNPCAAHASLLELAQTA